MKKGNRPARVAEAIVARLDDDDEMLPEYDFSKAKPAQYWKKLQQGATVFVNDEQFVIGAGRAWVRVDVDNPALFAAKLALANPLYELHAENRWNLTQLAAALQTYRRKAREFLYGELSRISVDQLMSWLKNVGFDTRINVGVTQQKAPRAKSLRKAGKRTKRSDAPARSAIA